jgi:2'-5' RNA ligase
MRLFVAMNLPATVCRSIAEIGSELAAVGIPAKWVPPASIHLTLKFLGSQDRERLATLESAVEEIARNTSPIVVRLGSVGAFPSPRRPSVIWVGVESGPRLRLLHDALDRRMTEFGVEREARPFRPHVTVGRVDRRAEPGDLRDFERHAGRLALKAEVEIGSIELMESRPGPGGAEYRPVRSARLAADR